jgi:large subunit ribosomal protein L15
VVSPTPSRGVAEVNVGDLTSCSTPGPAVTPEALEKVGFLKKRFDVLKVLGDGELKKKLVVTAHRFSASARSKIEAAGGSVTELPGKSPLVKNKKSAAKK